MYSELKTLKIHPKDNVIVALEDLKKGTYIKVNGDLIEITGDVKSKHKLSIHNLNPNDKIIMYGVVVGVAHKSITKGSPINTHNIKDEIQKFSINNYEKSYCWKLPNVDKFSNKNFFGYKRSNGSVGTENNWLVIPLVFCQNRNVEIIKTTILKELGYENNSQGSYDLENLIKHFKKGSSAEQLMDIEIDFNNRKKNNPLFPNVDGIYFLTHDGGCGGTREDSKTLCNLLAGYINNPNVAGATILSLGCQHAQIALLKRSLKKLKFCKSKPLFYLEQQKSKSEKQFIAEAIKKTFIGLVEANKIERTPQPLHSLVVGLECGGSDGFSGITANPTVGYFSDLLVALGGSVIISEFPELHGIEQDLINRCLELDKAKKFVQIMKTYNSKAEALGSGFYANPSPGNIKDGLITNAIKSAGAAKKGGTSPVVDVLDYTEQLTKKGLNLLCTPGNDVESTTGIVASGANLILFTTGLGTPTGNPAVPVIKISSNTSLFNDMNDIIDFNSGDIIDGKETVESCGEKLLKYITDVASGKKTVCARQLGQNDFIPWKRGISL